MGTADPREPLRAARELAHAASALAAEAAALTRAFERSADVGASLAAADAALRAAQHAFELDALVHHARPEDVERVLKAATLALAAADEALRSARSSLVFAAEAQG